MRTDTVRSEIETVESSPIVNYLELALFSAAGLGVLTLMFGACAEMIRVL